MAADVTIASFSTGPFVKPSIEAVVNLLVGCRGIGAPEVLTHQLNAEVVKVER
jgi:hypothetical protein